MAASKRRTDLLHAAFAVVGEHGMRGLSHRAVDRTAGVPLGTTSNYFRTRAALVHAIVAHLADHYDGLSPAGEESTPEELVSSWTRLTGTPHDSETNRNVVAWSRLQLEAATTPSLRSEITRQYAYTTRDLARQLARCGSTEPTRHADHLLVLLNGLLIRPMYDPDAEHHPEHALSCLLRGMLGGPVDEYAHLPPVQPGVVPDAAASNRREQVLGAAVEVLAGQGTRGFTHRAVDRAASLPAGTSSNYFPTRKALVEAAVHSVTSRSDEVRDMRMGKPPADDAELVTRLGTIVRGAVTLWRRDMMAVLQLSCEAATLPELAPGLARTNDGWRTTFAGWLTELGVARAEVAGASIDALVLGLILVQYARAEPNFVPETTIAPMVRGLLS